MLEMGTSGLMSGEGKRVASGRRRHRVLPRLYDQCSEKPQFFTDFGQVDVFSAVLAESRTERG